MEGNGKEGDRIRERKGKEKKGKGKVKGKTLVKQTK